MPAYPCQILLATAGSLRNHLENAVGFAAGLMGFCKDVEGSIVAAVPKQRQTLFLSATVLEEVRQICHIALKSDCEFINTVQEAASHLMARHGSWVGSSESSSQQDESHQLARHHIEPIYNSFVCPLTKQVMRDPVTIETGQTFEREAIEKWFKECKESGRKLFSPLTLQELKSTYLNPSVAVRHTIEEWTARNEAAQLDLARASLSMGSSEGDILQALSFVLHMPEKQIK